MWTQFFLSFALGAVVLFLPGYLAARALRIARPLALGIAPAVSCGMLEIWAFIAWKAGIWADWATIALPVTGLAAVLYAASSLIARKRGFAGGIGDGLFPGGKAQAATLAAFAGAGILLCGLFFVKCLDGPCSIFQAYDNLSHMLRIRAFVDTGAFSPVGIDMNYNLPNPPFEDHATGFYPSSWHCVAALAVSMLGAPVAMSVNAVNAVFIALVVPVSAWSFLSVVLRGRSILPCAILPLSFAAFPWGMVDYGPLYPNMAAFALILGTAACFIAMIEARCKKLHRVALGAAFTAGVAGIGLSHPNAVFVLGIILAAYTCSAILRCPAFVREDGSRSKLRWAAAALFFAFAVLVWIVMFNSSFMYGVVHFFWPSFLSIRQSFFNLALFSLRDTPAQFALSVLAACGMLYSLRNRKYLWLTAAFFFTAGMYLLNVATDSTVKMWFTGFWYQDSFRISGLTALAAMPLAALGLTVVLKALRMAVDAVSRKLAKPLSQRFAAGLAIAVCTFAIYCPGFNVPGIGMVDTAFGYMEYLTTFQNDSSREDDVLGAQEREFLQEVARTVEPGSIILNHPYDGSAFAAANYDLNVYWRTWGGYNDGNDGQTSQTLRNGLDRFAWDPEVQEAVRESGAAYLLLLDQGTLDGQPFMKHTTSYHPENWPGVEAVCDQTPGLETILAQDDMRLYRIAATESE